MAASPLRPPSRSGCPGKRVGHFPRPFLQPGQHPPLTPPRQLNNFAAAAQEVSLLVQDAQGFVFSGDKATTLTLPPRGEARAAWHCVAHAPGELALPCVHVSAPRLGASVTTQSGVIHVTPF